MARPVGPNVAGGRLPVSKRDRRPALAALALLLVVAGALGSALVAYRSGHRTDVLVAAHEIKLGQQVSTGDFSTARVATDNGGVVPAGDEQAFVDSYATTDIPAGTLINSQMFQNENVMPIDGQVVGVPLGVAQRPATPIATGDVVRVWLVSPSGQSSNGDAPAKMLVNAARVTEVESGSNGATTVSLLISDQAAPFLINAASENAVALTELPKSIKPTVDYRRTRP